MDQKRTLWILIATGVFLCFVLGAAFIIGRSSSKKNTSAISMKDSDSIWISPSTQPAPQPTSSTTYSQGLAPREDESASASPSLTAGLSSPAEGVSSVNASSPAEPQSTFPSVAQTENLTVIANGNTNVYQIPDSSNNAGSSVTTFDLTSGVNTYSSSSVTAQNKAAEDAMKNTEAAHKSQVAQVLDESTKKPQTTVSAKTGSGTADASSKKTVASSSAKSTSGAQSGTPVKKTESAKSTSKASTASSAKSVASTQKIPDRYWVQAASYSSKKKADEARSLLDENKIQCEVFTYDSDGTLYYRVRVGPYSTKDEASYWKKQVDSIELFSTAGTYVVNSSAPIAKN